MRLYRQPDFDEKRKRFAWWPVRLHRGEDPFDIIWLEPYYQEYRGRYWGWVNREIGYDPD